MRVSPWVALRAQVSDAHAALAAVDIKKSRVFPMFFTSRACEARTLGAATGAVVQLQRGVRCTMRSPRRHALRAAPTLTISCARRAVCRIHLPSAAPCFHQRSAIANIPARVLDSAFEKPRGGKKSIANFENDVARFSRITTKILNGVEMMLVQILLSHKLSTRADDLKQQPRVSSPAALPQAHPDEMRPG